MVGRDTDAGPPTGVPFVVAGQLPILILQPTMTMKWRRTPTISQFSMFADQVAPNPAPTADLDRVRRKLVAFLTEAREAGAQGLPLKRRRLMETVMPQMMRWLPKEEAELTQKAFEEALAA